MSDIHGYKLGILITIFISPVLFFLMIRLWPNLFHCAYLTITGEPCPLCGTTRAVILASKLRFAESIQLNPLGLISIIDYIISATVSVISMFIKRGVIELHIITIIFIVIFTITLYCIL